MTVVVENLTIDLPIYSAQTRSFRRALLSAANVGGGIHAERGGPVSVRALEDVSFELSEGDRLALLGHNGAGKTTLLRALAGVYAPTGGRVIVKGRLSNMFDISLGLDEEATGEENIRILGYSRGLDEAAIKRALPDVIAFAELGAFIKLPVKAYSAGMRSRLAFAVATSSAPDILLMDEWISTGDADFRTRAEARLADRIEGARVLVLATHDIGLVKAICNKYLMLQNGRLVTVGEVAELSV